MHVNLLQYRDYLVREGQDAEISRIILLTPNERLSSQHLTEFRASGISADIYLELRGSVYEFEHGLDHVDILEITKLGDEEKDKTIATRSLGDQNLLLVDEGHRGMSNKEEGVWFSRRAELCAKGFTFEYSATFEQAVQSSGRSNNSDIADAYAKAVIYDYSYRWFYEDGFGKDYHILNLPNSMEDTQTIYLVACLLKFYQQLRIYEEREYEFHQFNLEKPLWIFVGTTVSSIRRTKEMRTTVTDVAIVVRFIANFLEDSYLAIFHIGTILRGTGLDSGLLDEDNNDIFAGAFRYLTEALDRGETEAQMYRDILVRLFHCSSSGGHLTLKRIAGDSGEILLKVEGHEIPFGLISVGDAKALCDHIAEIALHEESKLTVQLSDFTDAVFPTVADSKSSINLLVGSKKFVEGWDCWRVSTMGLMHVGKGEGPQIIQLFGRGVRLKGYRWSLKRSSQSPAIRTPKYIRELETLNVFGVGADFMEKFRDFLTNEGLPGNERYRHFELPLKVTHDFGKKLLVLRPKRKSQNDMEYEFQQDASAVTIDFDSSEQNQKDNRIVVDWYPRIKSFSSRADQSTVVKDEVSLLDVHLAFLDYTKLCFELEQFKNEKGWYNLNVTKQGLKKLLYQSDWYTLYLPKSHLQFSRFEDVLLIQRVVSELLKRYIEKYYNFCKRRFFETRLEFRELSQDDENVPIERSYQLTVAETETQVIEAIQDFEQQVYGNRSSLSLADSVHTCSFERHLYEPLFHIRPGKKIFIHPVSLNESEIKFVQDLNSWYTRRSTEHLGDELFLLRNLSRGRGIGFFEAGNFHPDFIMWLLRGDKQYVSFVEPHGMGREGPGSNKVKFHRRIKNIQRRIDNPYVFLNSFILSWTQFKNLPSSWDGMNQKAIEDLHVLFMHEGWEIYIDKLFSKITEVVH